MSHARRMARSDGGLVRHRKNPDGATRIIIEYAARHGLGFAVVPCCSDNGMPYKPWMRHLADVARDSGITIVEEATLPMDGRARVLLGLPR